eukprot:10910040-Heterocapsa_arctica.AAC.1
MALAYRIWVAVSSTTGADLRFFVTEVFNVFNAPRTCADECMLDGKAEGNLIGNSLDDACNQGRLVGDLDGSRLTAAQPHPCVELTTVTTRPADCRC